MGKRSRRLETNQSGSPKILTSVSVLGVVATTPKKNRLKVAHSDPKMGRKYRGDPRLHPQANDDYLYRSSCSRQDAMCLICPPAALFREKRKLEAQCNAEQSILKHPVFIWEQTCALVNSSSCAQPMNLSLCAVTIPAIFTCWTPPTAYLRCTVIHHSTFPTA